MRLSQCPLAWAVAFRSVMKSSTGSRQPFIGQPVMWAVSTGDGDKAAVQLLDVDSGTLRPLTERTLNESLPLFSPDGSRIAHW